MTETGDVFSHLQTMRSDGEGIVRFLRDLREAQQQRLTVIWDGAPIHRGDAVTTCLRTENHGAIQLERLPAYSPELNADEQVWASVKEQERNNRCCTTLEELTRHVVAAFERLKHQPELIRRFFHHPDVGFY
jgi:transposase